jgi:hypothetical protein
VNTTVDGARPGAARRPAARARLLLLTLAAALVLEAAPGADGAADADAAAPAEFDWGFVACRDTDLDGNSRLRVLGPVFERLRSPDGKDLLAVRPFYSRESDPSLDRVLRHYLWPVASVKDLRGERYWHVLTAYGTVAKLGETNSAWRVVVTPTLVAGRNAEGEGYLALVPFGGKMLDMIGQDRIVFVMFPAYLRMEINGIRSDAFLWPFVETARGGLVRRFRVFPFYGRSVREGVRDASFVLWPFWTQARYWHGGKEAEAFMLFPLLAHARADSGWTWMALPPFFRVSVSEKKTVMNLPWPFVQYASGGTEKLYLWPLWGRREQAGMRRTFYAWPLVVSDREDRTDETVRRVLVNPVAQYERRTLRDAGGQEAAEPYRRSFRLWPLVSYRRHEATSQVRVPDLWPTQDMLPVEKNMAPLWTAYTWTRRGQAREHEVLWGVYRFRSDGTGAARRSLFPFYRSERDTTEDRRRWDVLMGLAGYERDGLRRQCRLLYCLEFGDRRAKASGEAGEADGAAARGTEP